MRQYLPAQKNSTMAKKVKFSKNIETNVDGMPVEMVESVSVPFETRTQPQADPKPTMLAALQAEVNAIADGKPIASVVWRFNTLSGSQSGASLKFYQDCKTNEIETGVPCNLVSPSGAPSLSLPGSQRAYKANAVKPKCPNCK